MKKRLWAILLSICLVMTLLPNVAMAADNESVVSAMNGTCGAVGNENKVRWELAQNNEDSSNPTYTLTISGTGDMKDFDVATGTGANKAPWFTSLENATQKITAVTIADGVTSIGNYALSKITSLTTINGNDTSSSKSIVFPAQLTSWGYSLNGTGFSGVLSFPENCKLNDLNSLNIFGNNNITGFNWANYPCDTIMGSLTEFGVLHTTLTDLGLDTLPDTVKNIGGFAFKNFQGTSVNIPDTSINYQKGTFVNSKLQNVTINVEKSGSKLAESMFSQSEDLTAVHFIGNNLQEIPGGTFCNTKISYLSIPYGVTTIESNSKLSTEHAATFGLGASKTDLDTAVAFIFPSSLSKITANNNLDELFGNRSASNVKILAPSTFAWREMHGGLKEFTGKKIDSDLNGLYKYSLTSTAFYGDTVKVFEVSNFSGESTTLPSEFGVVSYEIENENVLSKELKAVSVGTTKVEIFITKPNTDIKTKIAETTVTVSPKPVSVTMTNKAETWDGSAKTIVVNENNLPNDLGLLYSYKATDADDSTYTHIPPTAPGTYTVKVESSANYTLTGTTTATLTISAPAKTDVSESVTVNAPSSLVYDGSAKSYTATYEGISDWTYTYYNADGNKLDATPIDVGSYTVTIAGSNDSSYAVKTVNFIITQAKPTVKITADQTSLTGSGTVKLTVTGAPTTEGIVTVTCGGNTYTPSLENGKYVVTVDLPNETKDYDFTASYTAAENGNYENAQSNTCKVSVARRSSGGGSSSDPTYFVTTPSASNGSVTVSPKNASKGDRVTITVKPDSGYTLETLTVIDSKGNEIQLTDKGEGKYTFTMPAGKVEVKATFMDDNTMLNFFVDVKSGDYYYDAVLWAARNGITSGTDAVHFSPEQPCTRAQIVTFLWRAAGAPEPKGTAASLTDVASGSYYEKAVAWAIENGITTGTGDGKFSPDDTCTRAQAVTFLARALNAKAASAAEFSDVPTDSYFADAVAWAAANGVTEGIGGGLFGSDNDCTRGQIVTFLYRAYNK